MSEQATPQRYPHTAMGIKAKGLTGYLRDQKEAWAGVGDADQESHFAALLEAVEELESRCIKPGQVVVSEEELRGIVKLIVTHTVNCDGCPAHGPCPVEEGHITGKYETIYDVQRDCKAALLAYFGLAPEKETTHDA